MVPEFNQRRHAEHSDARVWGTKAIQHQKTHATNQMQLLRSTRLRDLGVTKQVSRPEPRKPTSMKEKANVQNTVSRSKIHEKSNIAGTESLALIKLFTAVNHLVRKSLVQSLHRWGEPCSVVPELPNTYLELQDRYCTGD